MRRFPKFSTEIVSFFLTLQVPAIIKAVHIQLRERSIRTRQDCLHLLRELVNVVPNALTSHVSALIPGIQYSLGYVSTTIIFILCVDDIGTKPDQWVRFSILYIENEQC